MAGKMIVSIEYNIMGLNPECKNSHKDTKTCKLRNIPIFTAEMDWLKNKHLYMV